MSRINRARDKESMVQILARGEDGIFDQMWQLLMFAAAVGVRRGRREPLGEVDSGRALPQALFDKSAAGPGFQYLLTLMQDGDARHLADKEENNEVRVKLFEEYANGGLAILHEELEKNNYSLDALIKFIESEQPDARVGDLSDVKL